MHHILGLLMLWLTGLSHGTLLLQILKRLLLLLQQLVHVFVINQRHLPLVLWWLRNPALPAPSFRNVDVTAFDLLVRCETSCRSKLFTHWFVEGQLLIAQRHYEITFACRAIMGALRLFERSRRCHASVSRPTLPYALHFVVLLLTATLQGQLLRYKLLNVWRLLCLGLNMLSLLLGPSNNIARLFYLLLLLGSLVRDSACLLRSGVLLESLGLR